jgi:hypothetical protein
LLAQEELYNNLWYCNIILKARQLGISTFVSLLFLDRCLFNSNCSAGIIAHTREDAEMLFRRVKLAYENLPQELRTLRTVNMDNARELQFNNGSLLRVGTSMRGSTLQYLRYLKSLPYTYLRHFVPHDAAAHEFGTGMTRVEIARDHGVNFTLAPRLSVPEGIDAVRHILNRCWFDEESCANGIRMLENYKREWDDRNGCWKENPLHNFASHGADAFRILAVSLNQVKVGMTAEDTRELRERALSGSYRYSPNAQLPQMNPYGKF